MQSKRIYIEDAEFSEIEQEDNSAKDVVVKVARALSSSITEYDSTDIANVLSDLVRKYKPGITGLLSKDQMQNVTSDLLTMTVTDLDALIRNPSTPIFLRIIGQSLLNDLDEKKTDSTYKALERAFGKATETKEVKNTSLSLSKNLTLEDYKFARESLL